MQKLVRIKELCQNDKIITPKGYPATIQSLAVYKYDWEFSEDAIQVKHIDKKGREVTKIYPSEMLIELEL